MGLAAGVPVGAHIANGRIMYSYNRGVAKHEIVSKECNNRCSRMVASPNITGVKSQAPQAAQRMEVTVGKGRGGLALTLTREDASYH